jgi:hypothetical protein
MSYSGGFANDAKTRVNRANMRADLRPLVGEIKCSGSTDRTADKEGVCDAE